MKPENTDTPLKADCPSATCSASSDTPETGAHMKKLPMAWDYFDHQTKEKMGSMEVEIRTLRDELKAHQEDAVTHFIAREELKEGLRKAILWAESAANRIEDREGINWTYLEEARRVFNSLPNAPAMAPPPRRLLPTKDVPGG